MINDSDIEKKDLKKVRRPPIGERMEHTMKQTEIAPTFHSEEKKNHYSLISIGLIISIASAVAGVVVYIFTTFTTYHYVDTQNNVVIKEIHEVKEEQKEIKGIVKETNQMLYKLVGRSERRKGEND